MLRRIVLLTVVALTGVCQEQSPPAVTQYEFLSGTVTELPPGKIVVNRAVLGKTAENYTFLITAETKIEGTLKVQARVTVGYKPNEQGEPVAVRIIVRQPQKTKK